MVVRYPGETSFAAKFRPWIPRYEICDITELCAKVFTGNNDD